MNTLRELAGYVSEPKLFQKNQTPSRIILFSIHQPTSDIFHLFTNIILMSAGRIIFHGTVQEAQTLFNSMGMICPLRYNPAEFYVNKISDPKVADEIMNYAGDKKMHQEIELRHSSSFDDKKNGQKVSWFRQVFLLSHRAILNFLHSPKHYLIELLILLVGFALKTFLSSFNEFFFLLVLFDDNNCCLFRRFARLPIICSRHQGIPRSSCDGSSLYIYLCCFLFNL